MRRTFERSEGHGSGLTTANIPSTETMDMTLEVRGHRAKMSKLPWALPGDS